MAAARHRRQARSALFRCCAGKTAVRRAALHPPRPGLCRPDSSSKAFGKAVQTAPAPLGKTPAPEPSVPSRPAEFRPAAPSAAPAAVLFFRIACRSSSEGCPEDRFPQGNGIAHPPAIGHSALFSRLCADEKAEQPRPPARY